jgi:hypothetical protein
LAEVTGSGGLKAMLSNFELPVIRDLLILQWYSKVKGPAEREARGITGTAHKATHIASPEIIIDHQNRQVLMLYHGLDRSGSQSSRAATSSDGLNFQSLEVEVMGAYLRYFQH